jgi:DNA-damage-inducible protein J
MIRMPNGLDCGLNSGSGNERTEAMNTLARENEVMTDKQWDGMLMMIAEIVEKRKDKEEILAAIKKLLRGNKEKDDCISMNIDEDVKQNAQRVFGKMGLDMTTAIELFLRAAIMEERIPFEIRTEQAYREAAHRAYIDAALDESMLEANDPNTERLSHADIMESLKKQRETRSRVHV